jgi:gliding motility-associated lipoprotein GldH
MNKLIIAISLLSAVACISPSHEYAHFESIKGQQWTYSDTLHFGFKPIKSEKLRISLSVRYQKEYEFSNLWIKITDKDGVSRVDIPLFDAEGAPLGKCSSGLCTQTISWKDVECSESDTLIFSVVQNMRKDPLENLSDFGIVMDKVKDQ